MSTSTYRTCAIEEVTSNFPELRLISQEWEVAGTSTSTTAPTHPLCNQCPPPHTHRHIDGRSHTPGDLHRAHRWLHSPARSPSLDSGHPTQYKRHIGQCLSTSPAAPPGAPPATAARPFIEEHRNEPLPPMTAGFRGAEVRARAGSFSRRRSVLFWAAAAAALRSARRSAL